MNRFFKFIGQVIGLLVILYVVIMLLLVIFVRTKDFTPMITKLFYDKTGQVIHIDKKISLSVFPWPGVKASSITIDNPKEFDAPSSIHYLAKIDKITARVKLMSLFHGNVELSHLSLNRVDLNLVTLPSGKSNWSNLTKFKQKPHSDKTDPIPQSTKITSAKQFPVIEISHSNVHIINLQSKSRTDLTNFNLHSPASQDNFTRQIIFNTQIKQDAPAIHVDLRLETLIHFNPETSLLAFKHLVFSTKWYQINYKLPKPITIIMRGDITFQANDFKTALHGNFGESEGTISISANKNNNQFSALINMKNIYSSPLAIILTGKDWLDGIINSSNTLSTHGKTLENWLHNLSGKGSLKITNGKIKGLNINFMIINVLNQFLSRDKQSQDQSDTGTLFHLISADYTINQEQLISNNFFLETKNIKATGQGKINLSNATINAILVTTYANNPKWKIPLKITGSIYKPTIQPNTSSLIQNLLEKKVDNKLGKTLDNARKQFKGLFD